LSIRIAGDGYEGFVVVDSLVGDTSAGGVRIYDDLELAEIGDLAREMSLKYALFRLPRGGAKAGLRLAPGLSGEERLRALRDFGRKLGPIVRNGIYNPGMDMNCGLTSCAPSMPAPASPWVPSRIRRGSLRSESFTHSKHVPRLSAVSRALSPSRSKDSAAWRDILPHACPNATASSRCPP
jgi:hypothetical protein